MPLDLTYPIPENILCQHSALGVCYRVGDELRNARTGNKLITRDVNLNRGWTLFNPNSVKGKPMFHVCETTLGDGTAVRVGACAPDEATAKSIIRAKLGLDAKTDVNCQECICDVNTATFEEVKKAAMANQKQGGDDSIQSMQQNVDPGQQAPNNSINPVRQNNSLPNDPQKPVQGATDPSAVKIPPENSPESSISPGSPGPINQNPGNG